MAVRLRLVIIFHNMREFQNEELQVDYQTCVHNVNTIQLLEGGGVG